PFAPAEGTELEITLDQQFEFNYPGFSIGRFRLYVTADSAPSLTNEIPADVRSYVALAADRRTPEQQSAIWTYFAGISPQTKPIRDKLATLQKQIAAVPVPQTPIMRELPADRLRPSKVHIRGNFLDQ